MSPLVPSTYDSVHFVVLVLLRSKQVAAGIDYVYVHAHGFVYVLDELPHAGWCTKLVAVVICPAFWVWCTTSYVLHVWLSLLRYIRPTMYSLQNIALVHSYGLNAFSVPNACVTGGCQGRNSGGSPGAREPLQNFDHSTLCTVLIV